MKAIRDLKVGMKLAAGFACVAIIAVVIGFIGIRVTNNLNAEGKRAYETVTVPLGELAGMSVSFQRVRINLRDAVEATDPAQRQRYVETVTALRQNISERMARYEKTMTSEEERSLFRGYAQARSEYLGCVERILAMNQAGRNAEARELLHGAGKEAALKQQGALDKLMAAKEQQGKTTARSNELAAASAARSIGGLLALGLILALVLGVVTSRMITRPLDKAVQVANRLAEGDLTVEVVVDSKDETGQLQAAMGHMVQSLRGLVTQTVQISSSIASASTQLQGTSAQIATGAEEVASQTGTVATGSEEMAATSADIARNCVLAAEASRQSSDSANQGAKVVQETITGMEEIAGRVRRTSKTVEALGHRSEEIGDIVGTIEDIADQTNLLALNAAIEAARAGEQGRGFAVVADEVRALAERTSKATKEIGTMIKAIQGETRDAVRAMDEGVQEAEKGAASSQRSGQALEDILKCISEVSLQVSQIATAAEQQTATTTEVTSNIQQITDVVQHTARGAEETAMAAAQLAQQADELQTLVARFRVA
ncbi:methyl-accepting chemotaxis protein [Geomonas sp. Red69]|uniref:Methyl-accepting chemotaxis protein n=1 Tax=Geomonas diazotrophica TaxID=2843197 RepID=A0ABX8JD83_9BACT|nr:MULTISPECIES: methyl-accepting chemotaxis protein [Geomonas]MBU5637824.1 methyl-accepting chemotaxis protein [Geomonas diazotrophica]QWV96355.1 methyl-accepting chemotaxis protein [Geomonas nitrogeniifigens]